MDLVETAKSVLDTCLALKAGERCLIVTDRERAEIGRALYLAAAALGAEAILMEILPRARHGGEPPAAVAAAMLAADVIVCPTTRSLTHTQARKAAQAAGARVATMPGITIDMFTEGAITADYARVADVTKKVTAWLDAGQTVRLVKGGKELVLSIAGRAAIASTGVYREPGEGGNLPSGEAYIAPAEGTAEGELVVDGSMAGLGRLRAPLFLRIVGGRLVHAEGPGADQLTAALDAFPQGRNVAELGIGTNDRARLTGVVLEDEKIAGTVHIAFGDNSTFGGAVQAGVHFDGVILAPDLYIDGRQVMAGGRLADE
jgi:leucyl aminopeptidase (aminopeptidase T)